MKNSDVEAWNMNDYEKRQSVCDCLTDERRGYIRAALDFASDFSDGAFMAYMAERGIDVSELEAFSLDHDCGKTEGKGKE